MNSVSRITHYASRFTSYILRFIPAILFFTALALYIRTACPTLGGGWDSEEFQHVASNLNIAHSTGYPLYLLIGKLFTTLILLGNVAYRMNLLSALIGAATVVVVYLNALTLTRRQIASIATAALFATNPAVWRQAGIASVGPLNLLLLALVIYALLQWREKKLSLVVAAFIFGLGLAHHRSLLFLAPAIAIFVLLSDLGILRRPRELVQCLIAFALPALFYLYIPLAGSNTPWYSNTFASFINEVSGSEAGGYFRTSTVDLASIAATLASYLHDSFGYLGLILILIGTLSSIPRKHTFLDSHIALFLGLGLLTFLGFAVFLTGEQDRYIVLPFAFLIYWFAIGVGAIQKRMKDESGRMKGKISSFTPALRAGASVLHPSSLCVVLALLIALPLPDRFRIADWSSFDRVYKQWDEIFTLPIPQHATLVGNWGQLNAMRYMQRIEQRRPDLQFVGTLYDTEPQAQAAQNAFANGRTIFLAPGIAQPDGDYRYALLGPLLELRDKPQMQSPEASKEIIINPSLTLVDSRVTTALEPYAPATHIAPNRTARVTLNWRADNAKDFIVRLRLYDPDGRNIAQKDEAPVRGLYPASQWQRGEYVNDVHNLLIPAGTPPGKYQLKMQTLDANTKQPTSDEIALTSFNIERVTNLTRDQVFIQHSLDADLGNNISLWGYGGFEGLHRAGESINGTLVFFAHNNVGEDLAPRLGLVNTSGTFTQEWQHAPIAFYPTYEWQKGEILKAYYDLQLSSNLPQGEYSLVIGFWQLTTPISKIEIVP